MKKITFNHKLFNPNFWHVLDSMKDETIRFIGLIGGSSSAKTYSTAQAIIYDSIQSPNTFTLCFRKQGNTIEKTIYQDCVKIIGDWNLWSLARKTKSPYKIVFFNGSVIDFSGMDDPEKIKGISQYKRVYLNEMSSFDKADFDQIRKRLRGMPGQQIIFDLNPIDELHWIKTELLDKTELYSLPTVLPDLPIPLEYTVVGEKYRNGWTKMKNPNSGKMENVPPNFILIKSTYLNNFWVVGSPDGSFGFYDVQTIADFERDKLYDYNFYRIYALGEWGKITRGGEFYKAFRTERDVVPTPPYDPTLPLHISFDENVNPYITLSVYQATGLTAWKIDEICLKNPDNTLKKTLIEFARRYPKNKSGLFVYGDRTSVKADAKLEKGQNFFTIILEYLKGWNPVLRLPSQNPPVALIGNFINEMFENNVQGCSFKIGDSCKNTITDYLYVKEAPDGTKLKEKAKDPNTGITYERFGHCSDTDQYFLAQYFKREFELYQRGPEVQRVVEMRKMGRNRY